MGYFDKTFFKFLFVFILILLLTLGFVRYVQADHCTVSKIAIIPGSWENTSTKSSLTLQAQSGANESCHVAQTLRFSITTTGSGSFTTQSGGTLQTWISSGSANRNFYYNHPSGENFTLTATAGYGGATDWTPTFSTTYPENTGAPTTTPNSEPHGESAKGPSGDSEESSHYGAIPLSAFSVDHKFKIGAGRSRTVAVGAPVELRVETNLEDLRNVVFRWSLGDGQVKEGTVLTHVYEHPGEYVVILNGRSAKHGQAVSRVNINAVPADISISSVSPDKIEISNNSPAEVNLYGRALVTANNVFVFPQDTIIKARGKVSFAKSVTGISATDTKKVRLVSDGESIDRAGTISRAKFDEVTTVMALENLIEETRHNIAVLEKPAVPKPAQARQPTLADKAPMPPPADLSQSASVAVAFSSPPPDAAPGHPAPPPEVSKPKWAWLRTLKSFFLGK